MKVEQNGEVSRNPPASFQGQSASSHAEPASYSHRSVTGAGSLVSYTRTYCLKARLITPVGADVINSC